MLTRLKVLESRVLLGAQLVLFLNAMAVSLGVPVLVYYAKELGGTTVQVGGLFATFGFSNMFSSNLLGLASDIIGRKPVLVASVLGCATGFAFTGVATNMTQLFLARAWLGFWSGVGSSSKAYVADVTDPGPERTEAMGRTSALTFIGLSAGAPVGSLLAMLPGHYRTPFIVGAIASGLIALFVQLHMPSSAAMKRERELEAEGNRAATGNLANSSNNDTSMKGPTGDNSVGEIVTEGLMPGAVPLLWAWCISFALTNAGIPAYWMVVLPMFLNDYFGYDDKLYAALTTVYLVIASLVQWYLLRIFADCVHGSRLGVCIVWSLVGTVGAFFLTVGTFCLDQHGLRMFMFFAGLALMVSARGFTTGIATPAFSALGDSTVQGRLMGLNSSLEVGGRIFGQMIVAMVYDYHPILASAWPGIAQALAALVCFLALPSESAMNGPKTKVLV